MQRVEVNYTRVNYALTELSAWLKNEIEKELEKPKLIRIK
jgi:hypothetical protein